MATPTTYFWPQRQSPLTGLHLLRDPQVWDDNGLRPFSPGMGNESDAYLRFYQKSFFKSINTETAQLAERSWYNINDEKATTKGIYHTEIYNPKLPRPLHVCEPLRAGDHATIPEPVSTALEKTLEDEEFREHFFKEFINHELLAKEGKRLHLSLIQAQNEEKRIANNEESTVVTSTNEDMKPAERASALSQSQNDINRAAGRSYSYTPDYTSDSDEEESDDDWYGYHDTEPPMRANEEATVMTTPALEVAGDENIDHSDSDFDSDSDSASVESDFEDQPHQSLEHNSVEKATALPPFIQELISNIHVINTRCSQDWNSRMGHLEHQLGFGNGRIDRPLTVCPWNLIPTNFNGSYPNLYLTNPEGETFALEEAEYDFSHPSWASHFEKREAFHRAAVLREQFRQYHEISFEEYMVSYEARKYWEDAQKVRNQELQEAYEREQQQQEDEARVAQQELECAVEEDRDSARRYTISEADMSSEPRELERSRRHTDLEEYLRPEKFNWEDEFDEEEDGVASSDSDIMINPELDSEEENEDIDNEDSESSSDSGSDSGSDSESNDDEEDNQGAAQPDTPPSRGFLDAMYGNDSDSSDSESEYGDSDWDESSNSGNDEDNTGTSTPMYDEANILSKSPKTFELELAAAKVQKALERYEAFDARLKERFETTKKSWEKRKKREEMEIKAQTIRNNKFSWVWSVRQFALLLTRLNKEGFVIDEEYRGPGACCKSNSSIGAKKVVITGALAEFVRDLWNGVCIDVHLLTSWLNDKSMRVQECSNTDLFSDVQGMLVMGRDYLRDAMKANEEGKSDERRDLVRWTNEIGDGKHCGEGLSVVWAMGWGISLSRGWW